MTDTTISWRDEIAYISALITHVLITEKDTHYEVRGRSYEPNPTISVITKDIDYFDGTRLKEIVGIVEKNHKKTWYTYHVTGCKIIVTTESGTMIDAFGIRLTFNFYEHKEEETEQ